MAEASKTEIEVVTKVEGITLTLTNDEAHALRAVCARISGDPDKSRRRHLNSIRNALVGVGLTYPSTVDITGSLRFENESSPL